MRREEFLQVVFPIMNNLPGNSFVFGYSLACYKSMRHEKIRILTIALFRSCRGILDMP